MRFDVVTLFPELFAPHLEHGITRRAFAGGAVDVRLWQLRDFADDAYRRVDDTTLDYTSTFVPPELRGRGVGERLVLHALDWARAEGRRVVPTCWFVGKMLDQHPEYADLRAGAA